MATLEIWHVPRDATRGPEHLIFDGAPKSTLFQAGSRGSGITLSPGDTLEAEADENLTVTVYGITAQQQEDIDIAVFSHAIGERLSGVEVGTSVVELFEAHLTTEVTRLQIAGATPIT